MSNKELGKFRKWILNLSPAKTFWIFGLLLPMYFIWMRNVGLFAIDKNGRNGNLFNLISIFSIGLSIVYYALPFVDLSDSIYLSFVLTLTIAWLICNAIVGKNMIDYENRNNEYFYGVLRLKEYVFRFFHLFYFFLSIYWLQMEVNKYLGENQSNSHPSAPPHINKDE